MSHKIRNNRSVIDVLLKVIPFLLFFIYLAWASCLPIGQSPDEYSRILVPLFISNNGYLPSGFEESIRNNIWGISYAFTTYGASLVSVVFIKIWMLFTDDFANLVFAARIPSCIFGALSVTTLAKASQLLGFRKESQLLLVICMGLLPQFAFLCSYHNADAFSAFCACFVIYSWAKAIKQGWNAKTCISLGIALGLLALSYYFAYLLIPLSIVFFCFTAKWQNLPLKKAVKYALSIFLIAFAIAGWFFIRNCIIYDGDFFARRAYYECSEIYAMDTFKPSDHMTPKMAGQSIFSVLFSINWLWTTFKSSICGLGYMQFFVTKIAYILCLILVTVSILVSFKIGIIDSYQHNKEGKIQHERENPLIWVLLVILTIGTVSLSAYYSWSADYQAQGRYVICAWIPILLAIEVLFNYIFNNITKSNKSRIVFICFVVLCSIVLLLLAFRSAYPDCFMGITYNYFGS